MQENTVQIRDCTGSTSCSVQAAIPAPNEQRCSEQAAARQSSDDEAAGTLAVAPRGRDRTLVRPNVTVDRTHRLTLGTARSINDD